ncbi:DUF4115 domain-containing protein, partial [Enterococcus hirae]
MRLTPIAQTPAVLAELDPLTEAMRLEAEDEPATTAGLPTVAPDRVGRLSRPEALDVPVLTARDG